MAFNGRFFIYEIKSDKDDNLLKVMTFGSVITYVSMLFNMIIIVILCRKNMISPATILIQGLAAADFLTAFSSYGLELVFHTKYECEYGRLGRELSICYLQYPYCCIENHLSILSSMFHTVSYLMTTFLGLQKVVAILFPIWTKFNLTNHKAIICCILAVVFSVSISLPRHFSVALQYDPTFKCIYIENESRKEILEYSSVYYLMLQTVLLFCCCVLMLMSAVFITYKLANNQFRGRMTDQRRQERKSVGMIVIVLITFLITEVPKVCIYLWFSIIYINGHYFNRIIDDTSWSWNMVVRYEAGMAYFIDIFSDDAYKNQMTNEEELMSRLLSTDANLNLISNYDNSKMIILMFVMEGIKLLTVVDIYYVTLTNMLSNMFSVDDLWWPLLVPFMFNIIVQAVMHVAREEV